MSLASSSFLKRKAAGLLKRTHAIVEPVKREVRYTLLVMLNPKVYCLEGINIPLRATPELQRVRRSVYQGGYERDEIEIIRHLLHPDDVVLELGSGCGVVSAFIARHLNDSSNLHTFEANPRLIASINAIASANRFRPNVTNAAVGLDNGEAEFFFDEEFVSSSFYDVNGSAKNKEKVQVVAIESIFEKVQPTFIFFDIEGAEQDIFTIPIPRQVRAICGELHPNIIGNRAVSEIIGNIMAQGFDLLIEHSKGQSVAFVRGN